VFGSFGRPDMAWELHYEDISGIANGSAIIFGELCRENNQIPSYTIIRNAYRWFLRTESVTYLLNQSRGGFTYSPDFYEGVYSSGAHVASGDKWLSLAFIENAGSYFEDFPEYDIFAYPFVGDIDGDRLPDILCGSSDGGFYFYKGRSFDGRFKTDEAVRIKDVSGYELKAIGYASPVVADIDGDKISDILSGGDDGNILLFKGRNGRVFESADTLVSTGILGRVMPEVGDLNGDGILDLIVGSNVGKLYVYYGRLKNKSVVFDASTPLDLSSVCAGLSEFIAPRIVELNGDGILDIAVGTFDGYIARIVADSGRFRFDGYLTSDEPNYKGNYNLKFGNNCVPFFADINRDGALDIIAGSLEYGPNYPIDSEYFPYREELQKTLNYMRDNYFYNSIHFFTDRYASTKKENYE
jgi:hypothetical protein